MYERTLRNITRLIEREKIEGDFIKSQEELRISRRSFRKRLLVFSGLSFLMGILIMFVFSDKDDFLPYNSHPLRLYFNPVSQEFFDSPFLNDADVLDNCPCSGFEGEWSMFEPFKLPLPGSKKPGLYYQAKSAQLILRCTNLMEPYVTAGKAIIGYEYLRSEIWIDTKQSRLVPKYFNTSNKSFTEEFNNLKFESLPQFKKVANLSAFNVNIFEIEGDSIRRKAELSGRIAIDIDEDLTQQFDLDIDYLTKNVLGDLTKTSCQIAYNPYCDPNDLDIGSIISFECVYTYPYTKSFELKDQVFSDYIACGCED